MFSIDHSLIIKDVHYAIKVISLYCNVLVISKIAYVNIKHRFKKQGYINYEIYIFHSYIISTFLLPHIKWNCRDVICQFSILYTKVLIRQIVVYITASYFHWMFPVLDKLCIVSWCIPCYYVPLRVMNRISHVASSF